MIIETPEEREEFNRVERESKAKQESIRGIKLPTREQLMQELVVAQMLIRELGDRLAKLERGNEPLTCPICNATAYPYPKCRCVTYEEKNT